MLILAICLQMLVASEKISGEHLLLIIRLHGQYLVYVLILAFSKVHYLLLFLLSRTLFECFVILLWLLTECERYHCIIGHRHCRLVPECYHQIVRLVILILGLIGRGLISIIVILA
jgi:hypothetical protein